DAGPLDPSRRRLDAGDHRGTAAGGDGAVVLAAAALDGRLLLGPDLRRCRDREISRGDAERETEGDAMTRVREKAEQKPAIKVYWAPGCSSCLRTKEFLTKRGIAFESVNVKDDA